MILEFLGRAKITSSIGLGKKCARFSNRWETYTTSELQNHCWSSEIKICLSIKTPFRKRFHLVDLLRPLLRNQKEYRARLFELTDWNEIAEIKVVVYLKIKIQEGQIINLQNDVVSWTFSSRRSRFSSIRNCLYLLPGNASKRITVKSAVAKSVRASFILAVRFAIKFGQLRKSIYGLFRHDKFMQFDWQKKPPCMRLRQIKGRVLLTGDEKMNWS